MTDIDTMPGCCNFQFDGHRCHYPGTFSNSTTGGGKWLCRAHSHPHITPEQAIATLFDSHKAIPAPDYSLAARRQASERRAWADIPDTLKGGTEQDYRDVIHKGILNLIDQKTTNLRAA